MWIQRVSTARPETGIALVDDSDPISVRASILFFRGDRVLLCRRTDEEDVWVLPGGTPARGDGTTTAALREIAEETGLQVAAERVVFVLEATSSGGDQHLIEIVFLGSERDHHAEPEQLEEHIVPVATTTPLLSVM